MTSNLKFKTSNVRLSNMELLRIIAMFLVLVVHADFFSLGSPTQIDILRAPLSSFTRFFFESLSIVCVNVFILISGWFGINPKIKSISSFLFQCFFYLWGIYALSLLMGHVSLSLRGIAECFFLLERCWFIKAYLVLYVVSPVLNAFVEHSTKKQFFIILVAFFSFQTIYAWGTNGALDFRNGYSAISFIGLYLLARYLRLYLRESRFYFKRNSVNLFLYFCIVLGSAALAFVSVEYIPRGASINGRLYSYISPLVILSSVCLLLYFSRLNFKSRIINIIAASSFAAYLTHTNINICETYFKGTILAIYDRYDAFYFLLLTFAFLNLIFLGSVFIDQFRIFLWKKIWGLFPDNK